MIRRNCRSASSMPAAVQRSAISPDCQRLTLRLVRRTHSIIDSQGFVEASVRFRVPRDPEAGEGERLVESLAQRAGGAGVAALELGSERLQPVERAAVIVERPGVRAAGA